MVIFNLYFSRFTYKLILMATTDEEEKFNEKQLERAKEISKTAWEGVIYSIQRMDLLVISISGAGIYICLESLKFLFEKGTCACNCKMHNPFGLKLSALFFTLSIIQNFISQWFATKAHFNKFQGADYVIEGIVSKLDNSRLIRRHENRSNSYDAKARFFDNSSIITMMVALLLMIIFLWVLL